MCSGQMACGVSTDPGNCLCVKPSLKSVLPLRWSLSPRLQTLGSAPLITTDGVSTTGGPSGSGPVLSWLPTSSVLPDDTAPVTWHCQPAHRAVGPAALRTYFITSPRMLCEVGIITPILTMAHLRLRGQEIICQRPHSPSAREI